MTESFSFTTQGVEFIHASLATRYFGREDLATYFPDPRESGWMFEALDLALIDHFAVVGDPDVVIGRWCDNVAKLLSIGVLPATPLARFTGVP